MKTRYLLPMVLTLIAACTLPHDRAKVEAPKTTLKLTLLPQSTLTPGKPTTVLVKLNNINQRSLITDEDLQTVEGQKIQLLVIDPMLTDYQYLTPKPTATRGVYSISFTPKAAHGYHVWADVTPVGGAQEFVMGELGTAPKAAIDKSQKQDLTIGGYHFTLSFDKDVKTGEEVTGAIRITDTAGNDVSDLGAIKMVGVYSDYRNILPVRSAGARSFGITPYKEGHIRLLTRATIKGKEFVVPFGVNVARAS